MLPTFWSLSYSPWSDRARWALDHCGVEYRRLPYQPLLGEPAMRVRTRNWVGPVSVPVLQTGEEVLGDSLDISRWADARRTEGAASLFPEEAEAEIAGLHELSEAALAAGRTLGLRRMLETHPDALDALVPPGLATLLGPMGRPVAAFGVRRTLRKYADVTPEDLTGTVHEYLDRLAEAVRGATPHDDAPSTLLGTFSFADITMAVGLSFIVPPASHLKLADASRRAYTLPDCPSGYDDVFAWRDAHFAARP